MLFMLLATVYYRDSNHYTLIYCMASFLQVLRTTMIDTVRGVGCLLVVGCASLFSLSACLSPHPLITRVLCS